MSVCAICHSDTCPAAADSSLECTGGIRQPPRPAGDFAIIELFGHQTLVGRVEEVERFGAKMLGIETIFNGVLLPRVFYGGAAIYGMTPCSVDIAYERAARDLYHLPVAMRAIVPPTALPAPSRIIPGDDYEEVEC